MPHRVLLSTLLLAAVQGCDAAAPCDPNQRFEGRVCVNEPPGGGDSGPSGAVDAGQVVPADGGLDAGSTPAPGPVCTRALDEALGIDCSAPPDCACPAPYCALMPGQTVGYCTISGCDPAHDQCPTGYGCFDLSSLGVTGVPTFCARQ